MINILHISKVSCSCSKHLTEICITVDMPRFKHIETKWSKIPSAPKKGIQYLDRKTDIDTESDFISRKVRKLQFQSSKDQDCLKFVCVRQIGRFRVQNQ